MLVYIQVCLINRSSGQVSVPLTITQLMMGKLRVKEKKYSLVGLPTGLFSILN